MIQPTTININECLDNSRIILNNNFSLFHDSITVLESVRTDITNTINAVQNFRTGSGTILQVVTERINTSNLILAGNQSPTGIEAGNQGLTIVRKSPTSRIIVELTGGHYRYSYAEAARGAQTYIFVRTGGVGSHVNITGTATSSLEAISPRNSFEGQHNVRGIYTPPTADLQLDFRVYASRFNTAATYSTEEWNTDRAPTVPFVFTLTEVST